MFTPGGLPYGPGLVHSLIYWLACCLLALHLCFNYVSPISFLFSFYNCAFAALLYFKYVLFCFYYVLLCKSSSSPIWLLEGFLSIRVIDQAWLTPRTKLYFIFFKARFNQCKTIKCNMPLIDCLVYLTKFLLQSISTVCSHNKRDVVQMNADGQIIQKN